jgi:RNA polymerase sigma-70 factor (ECF subfamily)
MSRTAIVIAVVLSIMLLLGVNWCLAADMKVLRMDNVAVEYAGAPEAYVKAIAQTAQVARTAAIEKFKFDTPGTIHIRIVLSPQERVRLYNDGRDRLFLTIRSEKDLHKPAESGIYHIYGICHEIGHLAMYRAIPHRDWLTPAGAEGWAHYVGSRLVDEVFSRQKEALWPDTYPYLDDGMKRFHAQQARAASPTTRGGALWEELFTCLGDQAVSPLLKAWGKAQVDPADPAAALRQTLLRVKAGSASETWWNKAEPLLIRKVPKSGFVARTAEPRDLARQPVELLHDDGGAAGKLSTAGSGHAVRFTSAGSGWYLTSVRLHGSRYGLPAPPREDFSVWLCDKDFQVISEFPQPYRRFRRGQETWVNLSTPPTEVPQEFIICVGFNPTATKGVYVSYDAQASGDSLAGLPGRDPQEFSRGDWLIRVSLDRLNISDALHEIK